MTTLLELGNAHGTATCCMAAAPQQLGRGQVTAVDLIERYEPSAEQQIAAAGLGDDARVARMPTGHNWFLHDEIVRSTTGDRCEPLYDQRRLG